MAPKQSSSTKSKVSSLNLKRFFNKLIAPKQSKHLEKEKDDHYEFDAVPDFPRKERKITDNSIPESNIGCNLNNGDNVSETNHEESEDKNPSVTENTFEEDETNLNTDDDEKDYRRSEKPNFKGASAYVQHTNITVNGGTGIHFGNVYSHVNIERCNNYSQPNNAQNKKHIEKTEEVRALLKSKDEIETAHLDFLSAHFGSKWKAIGTSLGLTTGELDSIKERYKNLQEAGFQMLKVWWQKRGEDATVGELCKKLWNGKVETAMEAVQELALNIEHMQ